MDKIIIAIILFIAFPWLFILAILVGLYILYTIIRDKINTKTAYCVYDNATDTITQVGKREYEIHKSKMANLKKL
jgi:hypothetical protein